MNKNCQSCGMQMAKPEDHGGGRPDNVYCRHCSDGQGSLLPRGTVREKMISFHMQSLGKTREQAQADVDKHMSIMPAWKFPSPGIKSAQAGPVQPRVPSGPRSSSSPSGPVIKPEAGKPGLTPQPKTQSQPSVSKPSPLSSTGKRPIHSGPQPVKSASSSVPLSGKPQFKPRPQPTQQSPSSVRSQLGQPGPSAPGVSGHPSKPPAESQGLREKPSVQPAQEKPGPPGSKPPGQSQQ